MAINIATIDTASGKVKNSGFAFTSGGFADQEFDVGIGGQTTFTATATITSTKQIDVFYNGVLMREGAGNDYTRNTGTNQIIFNFTTKQGSWVRIRIYS
jgi:hypothetical protein